MTNHDNATIERPTGKQQLSEKYKEKEDYLKAELDNTIASCGDQDKEAIEKAYIIRNGKRSAKKFEYLSEAYGIKLPAKIRHIPVLKTMFDAISAINQSTPLDFKVTSRDIESIKMAEEELKDKFIKDFVSLAGQQIKAANEFYESDRRGEAPASPDKMTEDKLKRMVQDLYTDFKSSIEISGQDVLESMIQRLEVEVMNAVMIEDLMCSGSEYYQVKALEKGRRPLVRVINPMDIYFRKDRNKKLLRDHSRVLLKEKVSLADVVMNFGHQIKRKDLERLFETYNISVSGSHKFWDLRNMSYTGMKNSFSGGIYQQMIDNEVTLHYGEWIANTEIDYDEPKLKGMEITYEKKKKYRKDRYEGHRINEDIYFGLKKSDFIYRPTDDPGNCFLTINGGSYNDRNGEAYSLVLNTEDIADKIDMLHYIWESMVAMSGNKAAMINYKAIPAWLSRDPKDRVMKWIGLAKTGAGVLDLSQPGAKDFANSGQIDFSIDQSVSVILEMIRYLEEVAGNITGATRQMRGSIGSDDLKGTTQMAINQSSMVLMPFFFTHSTIIRHMLTDIVNTSRLVYEKGFTGSYMMGDLRQKIFTIDNDKFFLADLDVWLSNTGNETKSIEELKALSIELIKANQIDAISAVDMNTIKSLSKIKASLKKSLRMKEENQMEQMAAEMQQVQQELEKVTQALQRVDQAKMQMMEREMKLKEAQAKVNAELKAKELDQRDSYETKRIELEKRRVELEALEVTYNAKAAEVKNT